MPWSYPPSKGGAGKFKLRPDEIRLSENDVEKACLDVLRVRGYYPLRQQSGLFKTYDKQERTRFIRVGEPGLPDYVIPAWFVEVKRPGARLSEVQREKIQTLKEHWDLDTAVVESLDELMAWLAKNPQP